METEFRLIVVVGLVIVLGGEVLILTRPTITATSSVVGDGDATRERCLQDCATFAKRTTDELRKFCAEPDRKCESLSERTDPTKWKPLYQPGNTARHASCSCLDPYGRIQSLWAGDEVW